LNDENKFGRSLRLTKIRKKHDLNQITLLVLFVARLTNQVSGSWLILKVMKWSIWMDEIV